MVAWYGSLFFALLWGFYKDRHEIRDKLIKILFLLGYVPMRLTYLVFAPILGIAIYDSLDTND